MKVDRGKQAPGTDQPGWYVKCVGRAEIAVSKSTWAGKDMYSTALNAQYAVSCRNVRSVEAWSSAQECRWGTSCTAAMPAPAWPVLWTWKYTAGWSVRENIKPRNSLRWTRSNTEFYLCYSFFNFPGCPGAPVCTQRLSGKENLR